MAVFQKESGTAHGRGFSAEDANGYLAKLDTWIVKAAGAGGPLWYVHDATHEASLDGNEYYVVYTDTDTPSVNDIDTGPSGGPPKYLQVGMDTIRAGYVFVKGYAWWDDSTQTGYGQWFGYEVQTYDDADFEYNFRGGAECMILQTRRGSTWNTAMWDEWTGDANFLEGTDKIGIVQDADPSAGGNDFLLQLDTGEGTNFTTGKYYYLCDFNSVSKVNYVQCTGSGVGDGLLADQIKVDNIAAGFQQNSIIGAYIHRWVSGGDQRASTVDYNDEVGNIPYVSSKSSDGHTHTFPSQSTAIYGGSPWSYESWYLSRMAPNDEGEYAVQRGGICEYERHNSAVTHVSMNRAYGTPKNSYLTQLGTMAAAQDGRVISAKNWLYFRTGNAITYSGSGSLAVLFLDTVAAA